MPYIRIQTNSEIDESGQELLLHEISSQGSRELGKPESYVMVALQQRMKMSFAGSDAICAFIELKSIGLPQSKTKALSTLICGLTEKHLGVPPDRAYIEFSNAERSMWGWNSGTF